MSYTALYREWRPKQFSDIVGQEHITTTLKNQILNNRIAHAYLFCGTRGTGKTSAAKVFAKAINCLDITNGEPCNKCEMCKKINDSLSIDVTELDAASNNGVDSIRDIIDEVKYPPQEGKYKIYIMDEVHMLSTGAVNAFLKTLEEPPENVVFILATTDPQKLPITILSRCQRFDFKRISLSEIINRLTYITGKENVNIDEKSLKLIAKVSDGAMRDALSILDQGISMGNGTVKYEELIKMLGLVANENLYALVNSTISKDIKKSIKTIDEIVYTGKDMYIFIKDLILHFRNMLMAKVTDNPDEVLNMSTETVAIIKEQTSKIRAEEIMRSIRILQEAEENAKVSKQGRMYLELAILKICKVEYDMSIETIVARINDIEKKICDNKTIKNDIISENLKDIKDNIASAETNSNINKKEESTDIISIEKIKEQWDEVLEALKEGRNMVVYASILTGRPSSIVENKVIVNFDESFKFNINRLSKIENIKILEKVLKEIYKIDLEIDFNISKE